MQEFKIVHFIPNELHNQNTQIIIILEEQSIQIYKAISKYILLIIKTNQFIYRQIGQPYSNLLIKMGY